MYFASHSRYQPVVRLGNWFEDICLEQDKLRVFRDLRDRGELLVEKTRRLFNNFHKGIVLEAPKENIRFGAVVQLMPYNMKICENEVKDVHAALSVIINEHVVRHSQTINDRCELTISPSVKPCVRNSFRICGTDDKERSNELLKYGQRFRLECVDTTDDPLLLYSAQKSADLNTMVTTTFSSRKHGELNLKLGLCLKRNCGPGKIVPAAYTNWFCQHMDPAQRFETDGIPLPSNKPLVITHAATNRNLAAENVVIQTLFGPNCGPGKIVPAAYTNWFCQHMDPAQRFETDGMALPSNKPLVITHAATNRHLAAENVVIQTLFGPEFLVSVQNYKNIYGRETWKNIWMIGNGHQFN